MYKNTIKFSLVATDWVMIQLICHQLFSLKLTS